MRRSPEQMKSLVSRGYSVMLDSGQHVSSLAEMPSAASLAIASGDARSREEAKAEARRKAEEAAAELRAIEHAEAIERVAGEKQAGELGPEPLSHDPAPKKDDKAEKKVAPLPEPKKPEPAKK
jgi:hypothetical protein